jgi:ABC-type polysaccharide/polyol phosphate export permease
MLINPLTYGTEALRALMYPGTASVDIPVSVDLAILGGFALVMFAIAFALANRRTTKPAA